MHCAVFHWGSISPENQVSVRSWKDNHSWMGDWEFRNCVGQMMHSYRPRERGALVLAGALLPQDLGLRRWFKSIVKAPTPNIPDAVAAMYALCPHISEDEDLSDFLMVRALRWSSSSQLGELIRASNDVLSIWRTLGSSGICSSCGETPG
jgi:hypothetical protein